MKDSELRVHLYFSVVLHPPQINKTQGKKTESERGRKTESVREREKERKKAIEREKE